MLKFSCPELEKFNDATFAGYGGASADCMVKSMKLVLIKLAKQKVEIPDIFQFSIF